MRLFAAITFLTRIPIPGYRSTGLADFGRSTLYFPLVGLGIGALQWIFAWMVIGLSGKLGAHWGHSFAFPAPLLTVLIVALGVWITGALHLEGLADMADGFGGGRTREDVLRIMRDHSVGAYGAVALILVLGLKFASIFVLVERGGTFPYLLTAPVLARWTIVPLGFLVPYARTEEGGLGAALANISVFDVLVSTIITLVAVVWASGWRGIVCVLVCVLASTWNAGRWMRRIHGMTGDTLGANTEICEALALATGCILVS